MVSIQLKLDSIDYEKSIENLLPRVVDSCVSAPAPSELEKLIGKLGNDCVPVAKKLLRYLDNDLKDQIIVWLVDSHAESITKAANQYLEEILPGKVVYIGSLRADDLPGSRLSLHALQVQIDYAALLNSQLITSGVRRLGSDGGLLQGAARFALQMGSLIRQENLEKQGITLLSSDHVKPRLLSALSQAAAKAGLAVRFSDMVISPDTAGVPAVKRSSGDEGLIPDRFEDALMDALVAWLREA